MIDGKAFCYTYVGTICKCTELYHYARRLQTEAREHEHIWVVQRCHAGHLHPVVKHIIQDRQEETLSLYRAAPDRDHEHDHVGMTQGCHDRHL